MSMSSLLGTTLSSRYRLEERIGSGGMSTVYRAVDQTLERSVAVKVMNQEIARDSDQLERFRREARAVAQLNHPNIVGVIDAGEDEGHPYIVFEYVEGETLKQRIRRLGRLPITDAVAYAIEIARALGAAHARHIVHRDVKPQNVLIDDQGTAKVMDFGIARSLEEHGLTDDGRVLGTTDYVSPEQALGHQVTPQSDLYSLGIVLYEMLTGELPFTAETQVAVAMKHVREELPDIRAKRPEVSAGLAAIVETATAKRLQDRQDDDQELIADLEELLTVETNRAGEVTDQVTSVMRTLPRGTRRRVPLALRHRTGALILAAVALVAVIGIVVWLGSRTHSGTPGGPHGHAGVRIAVCGSCAQAYNPYGIGGTAQNNAAAPYAVDGKVATAWTTEHYYSGGLDKPGVGVYVWTKQATEAGRMLVSTVTPGFEATVYGSDQLPNVNRFAASGWHRLSNPTQITASRSISLSPGGHDYRYYLLWITKLPSDSNFASVNEILLFGQK
jgi:tRNA A-37 threonylcarbamoyl transferase component Bud32